MKLCEEITWHRVLLTYLLNNVTSDW